MILKDFYVKTLAAVQSSRNDARVQASPDDEHCLTC